jgi:hypothetical protein
MAFDGYPTPGHYYVAKQREAERNGVLMIIGVCLLLIFVVLVSAHVLATNADRDAKQMELCMLKQNNSKICQLEVELN